MHCRYNICRFDTMRMNYYNKCILLYVALVVAFILVWFVTFRNNGSPDCENSDLSRKLRKKIDELNKALKRLQDREIECSVIENDCLKQKLHFDKTHIEQMSKCHKTETTLRELLIEEKDERIREKDQLLPFSDKLGRIDNTLNDIVSIGQEERDLIKQIIGKKFHPFTAQRIVHLDFKGAPPQMQYLLKIIKQVKELGGTGLLLEYEDMFPWKGSLESISRDIHYSEADIKQILKTAKYLDMEVIPSVPSITFMDFVLKTKKYAHLREHEKSTRLISPSNPNSVRLVKEMINQVLALHPKSKWIHLGAQDIVNVKGCGKCKATDLSANERIKEFMFSLFKYVRTFRTETFEFVKPIIWDNMIRKLHVEELKGFSAFVTPMISDYSSNVEENLPKELWDRYDEAFENIWLASSYKGETRPWINLPPIQEHVDNNLAWLKIAMDLKLKKIKVIGILLSGRSRYGHYAPLTSLFPASIPSLAICLAVLKQGSFDSELHKAVSTNLKFTEPIRLNYQFPRNSIPTEPSFEGGEILTIVEWREKAVGYDEWAKMRKSGWTRPYFIKHNKLNYFYLNETWADLVNAVNIFSSVKKQALVKFVPYFFKETITEWVEDKVVEAIKAINLTIKKIEKIFKNGKFP